MNQKYVGIPCHRCGRRQAAVKGLCHSCYNLAASAARKGCPVPAFGARRMAGRVISGWKVTGSAAIGLYTVRCERCGLERIAHYATVAHMEPHACSDTYLALLPLARLGEIPPIRALAACDGNCAKAAQLCGCTRQYVNQCYHNLLKRKAQTDHP